MSCSGTGGGRAGALLSRLAGSGHVPPKPAFIVVRTVAHHRGGVVCMASRMSGNQVVDAVKPVERRSCLHLTRPAFQVSEHRDIRDLFLDSALILPCNHKCHFQH